MKHDRLREILNSEETIEILHQNQPVWVNNFNPKNGVAQVTDNTQNSIDVSADELIEGSHLE